MCVLWNLLMILGIRDGSFGGSWTITETKVRAQPQKIRVGQKHRPKKNVVQDEKKVCTTMATRFTSLPSLQCLMVCPAIIPMPSPKDRKMVRTVFLNYFLPFIQSTCILQPRGHPTWGTIQSGAYLGIA